jgi:hypothetical protein
VGVEGAEPGLAEARGEDDEAGGVGLRSRVARLAAGQWWHFGRFHPVSDFWRVQSTLLSHCSAFGSRKTLAAGIRFVYGLRTWLSSSGSSESLARQTRELGPVPGKRVP